MFPAYPDNIASISSSDKVGFWSIFFKLGLLTRESLTLSSSNFSNVSRLSGFLRIVLLIRSWKGASKSDSFSISISNWYFS